jgi:hypothetical protein
MRNRSRHSIAGKEALTAAMTNNMNCNAGFGATTPMSVDIAENQTSADDDLGFIRSRITNGYADQYNTTEDFEL